MSRWWSVFISILSRTGKMYHGNMIGGYWIFFLFWANRTFFSPGRQGFRDRLQGSMHRCGKSDALDLNKEGIFWNNTWSAGS